MIAIVRDCMYLAIWVFCPYIQRSLYCVSLIFFYQGTNFINVKLNFQVPQFYQLVFEMELQSKSPLTILIPMIILLNSSLTLKIIQTRNWSLWTTSGNLENGSRKFPNVFSRGKERAYLVAIKVVLPQVNISVSWVMKFITYFILWIDIMKGQKVIFNTLSKA